MTQPAKPGPIVCPDCHQIRPPLNLIHQCHGCVGCAVHDQDETTGAPQPDPAAEVRAAAESVRNGNAAIAESNVAWAIAQWLDTTADYYRPGPAHQTHVVRALAVARALLGGRP